MTRADIDLDRGQEQPGDRQRRVTGFAHGDKTVFIHPVMDMDACPPLVADGRFPAKVFAARGLIVVTEKQAGLIGQAQQPSDGPIEGARVAAGEIGAPCHSRA